MMEILVPIFICVVGPVLIVAIIFAASMNSVNQRSKVLIKAIEANCNIDADKLAEALQKPRKTAKEILNMRLLRGCIFSLIGLVLCIAGIVMACVTPGSIADSDSVVMSLILGGVSLAIGLSYIIVYLVTRKQVNENH